MVKKVCNSAYTFFILDVFCVGYELKCLLTLSVEVCKCFQMKLVAYFRFLPAINLFFSLGRIYL